MARIDGGFSKPLWRLAFVLVLNCSSSSSPLVPELGSTGESLFDWSLDAISSV